MATSTITIISGASSITLDNTVSTITLGSSGPQGAPGEGVPTGGTAGQILQKDSATDYDTSWIDNFTTDVRVTVKNDSGSTLPKGTVVYVSGANGTNILVKPAIATSDATSATTIGFLLQSLAANASGYVITQGSITGLNTSAGTAGDPVWLSPTVAGGVVYGVANKPQAPYHLYSLGVLTRSNAVNGEIQVFVNNGWELEELHNVKITSPTNGQVLTYDSAQSLWVNSSETGDISAVNVTSPITGGGTSGAVTIGIDQTALSIAESQVVNLVTDLAARTPTSRTLTAGTGLTGGGNLTADRTFTLDNTVVSYDASSSLRALPLYNQKDAAEKLLAQAVFWIDAAHSSASGQTITNLGWGGSTLNATAGSTGSADSNDPKFLDWTGTNYIYIPGVSGCYLSVPDANDLDITGSIDLRAQMALDDWTATGTQGILSKFESLTQISYYMTITTGGYLNFLWTTDGTTGTQVAKTSSAAVSFTAGQIAWVRVTRNSSTGDVTFYTSTDGSTWTQLGTVQTSTAGSMYSGTSIVEIGDNRKASATMTGKVYNAQILNGIGGTVVLNVDTSVITSGAATSFTALTGQTVTINRATSGRKTCVVTNPLWLFGTDDYMEVSDNDAIDFALTDSMTLFAVNRQWNTFATGGVYLAKTDGSSAGYMIQNGSGTPSQIAFRVLDGTNTSTAPVGTKVSGQLQTVAGVRDVSADTVQTYVNAVAGSTATDTTTATSANSGPLRIGKLQNPNANYGEMELEAIAIFRRPLSATEITLLNSYYQNRVA